MSLVPWGRSWFVPCAVLVCIALEPALGLAPARAVPASVAPAPQPRALSSVRLADDSQRADAVSPALVRVSSSFEVKHAAAVLKQVAKLFRAGFIRKDAEAVAKEIDSMPAEQSRTWQFNGDYKGTTYALQVRARLDDFGMLDLDFFTAPALAGPVRGAVDGYLSARGL